MKKYPFSKKAMKAMIAASIAFTPLATTGVVFQGEKVEAATATVANEAAIDRMELIYSKIPAEDIVTFNEAAAELDSWTHAEWTALLEDIPAEVNPKLLAAGYPTVTAESIAEELAFLVWSAKKEGDNDLSNQLAKFKASDEGKAFEEVVGMNGTAIDTILQFLVDAEKNLWNEITQDPTKISNVDAVAKQVRDNLISSPKYATLNTRLAEALGTNLEGVFEVKDNIVNKLISENEKYGTLRTAFVKAALAAGNPNPPSSGGGGGGYTPPAPTPLPDGVQVTPVVQTIGNEVIAQIPESQVQAIVDLLTAERDTIVIPLPEVSAGQTALASIPAELFIQALAKNPEAVIVVEAEGASFRLPVADIDVNALAQTLGVSPTEVNIEIAVNVVPASEVGDTIEENDLDLVSDVVEFSVAATANGQTEEITRFDSYVERTITGDAEFDTKTSVGVRFNEDGTFQSVPTVFEDDEAVIKSVTNSLYAIVENNVTFSDVNNGRTFAEEYIETLASKYIIQGKGDGTYASGAEMTRAEFTALLIRALSLPGEKYDNSFTDVRGNEWFNKNGELMAAIDTGIVKGLGNGKFGPTQKIKRSEAAAMISRALELDLIEFDESKLNTNRDVSDFDDSRYTADWAKRAIEKVYQAGIMEGKGDGSFDPNGYTTRAEMAKILAEFLIAVELMNDIK
ncbi:MAG TPA: S-layer homology domain-containing protein [Chondromyces sp.]|nr:S-layer homology domain-containing protein [Chondromyces sp.]